MTNNQQHTFIRGLLLLAYGYKAFAASQAAVDLQPVLDNPCVNVTNRVYQLLDDLVQADKLATHTTQGVTLYTLV